MSLGRMRQNQLFGQDLQNLQAHQNALAGMGPEAAAMANAPIPNLRSMQMQQMMAPGMLQSLLPMNPLQQAQTEYYNARAEAAGLPPQLTPGQQIDTRQLAYLEQLEAKEKAGTLKPPEAEDLRKMRVGVSPVQITMGQPASPSERTAIAEGRASMDALTNLKTLFDSARTKTGPVVGRTSPIKGLVGMTTAEQEAFMAATSAFKNQVIKDITGAQMSEKEAERIMKQIPDITDPPTRWKAKHAQTQKNLQDIQKRREEVLRQSGLKVPTDTKGTTTPQVRQAPSNKEMLDALNTVRKQMPNATPQEQAAAARALLDGEQLPSDISTPRPDTLGTGGVRFR
jgi:hypothetical protein